MKYGSKWAWSVDSALILGATLYLPVRIQRKRKGNISLVFFCTGKEELEMDSNLQVVKQNTTVKVDVEKEELA